MIVETVTTTINPDGTVNCAAMGVEWGDEAIVIKPYRATRTLRNLERTRRGGRATSPTTSCCSRRRRSTTRTRRPGRRRRSTAPCSPTPARGARSRSRRSTRAGRGRGSTTRVVGRGHRARVRRLQPRVRHAVLEASILASRARRLPAGGDPRRARAPGRSWWTRRPGRASARRWTSSWRTCAPRSATDDDGPRRGAGAPAPGHARRLRRRRRGGSAGSAWPCARPAAVVEASRERRAHGRGPGRRARAGGRASAAARRSAMAGGARIRVLEAIPPHVGLGSGTKLALAVTAALCRARRDGRPTRAAMARTAGRGARSAVGLWTFALGGLVVEGGRAPRRRRARAAAGRATRCRRSGAACSRSRRPSRGSRAAPRRRRSPTCAPTPSARRGSPSSC